MDNDFQFLSYTFSEETDFVKKKSSKIPERTSKWIPANHDAALRTFDTYIIKQCTSELQSEPEINYA